MTVEIRIDDHADGHWVMAHAGGVYNERVDRCISLHRGGRIRGGVVFTGFMGSALVVHMAGDGTNWATRDFLWMVYDYSFNQLGVRKLVGMVAGRNHRALAIDLRMGFHIETRVRDILPGGDDLVILVMDRADAKWLNVRPRHVHAVPPAERFSAITVH